MLNLIFFHRMQHFENSFGYQSIQLLLRPAIQIRWKLCLPVIPLLAIRSQQIFAHAMTAQLLCHVQNFVAITVLESRWEWNEISIEIWIAMEKPLVKRGPGDPDGQSISSHGIVLVLLEYCSFITCTFHDDCPTKSYHNHLLSHQWVHGHVAPYCHQRDPRPAGGEWRSHRGPFPHGSCVP